MRPAGWTPPRRDRVREVVRTARVVGGMLVEMARDASGDDTTTAAGLARVRERFLVRARQLGVAVRVHGTVSASGGLVLMWNQTSHLDHLVLPIAMYLPAMIVPGANPARS